MKRTKTPRFPVPRAASVDSVLATLIDGKVNLDSGQAAQFLGLETAQVYELVKRRVLHAVRVGHQLVFPRLALEEYRDNLVELECVRAFQAGDHPLDVYQRMEGRARLRDVEGHLRQWAKLSGTWLVEAPRGSYQRWLARFDLLRVSPRALRRFIEAMLTDDELGARARSYFADQRQFNGGGEKAAQRAQRKGRAA